MNSLDNNEHTKYKIYSSHSNDKLLVDKLLGLFVQAFINTEVDTVANKRNNNTPIKEDNKNE